MVVAIPNVLTPEIVAGARVELEAAEWVDGRISAGHQGAKVKDNLQLPAEHPVAQRIGLVILQALGRNPVFISAALPLHILPPMFNQYSGGQNFGTHVDGSIRAIPGTNHRLRTDLSATLFFAEPEEYDGGELIIEDTYGSKSVKLPAGHLILYPATSLHRVTPVTRGKRVSAFFWIQSLIRDDVRRALLREMDVAIQGLGMENATHSSVVSPYGCLSQLAATVGGDGLSTMRVEPGNYIGEGQAAEARGDFPRALMNFEKEIMRGESAGLGDPEGWRRQGVAWMNRGNAERKLHMFPQAQASYTRALEHFASLEDNVQIRGHRGAAWLNHGESLLALPGDSAVADAIKSLEIAVELLGKMPVKENPIYALNLAGAKINLAQACLVRNSHRSRELASGVLVQAAELRNRHLAWAALDLRARRLLVLALEAEWTRPSQSTTEVFALVGQGTDLLEAGLILAKEWEQRGIDTLRPLARRLFTVAAQLYRSAQPHFLGEFVRDQVGTEDSPWRSDLGFIQVAVQNISAAIDFLERAPNFVSDSNRAVSLVAAIAELRSDLEQLSLQVA